MLRWKKGATTLDVGRSTSALGVIERRRADETAVHANPSDGLL